MNAAPDPIPQPQPDTTAVPSAAPRPAARTVVGLTLAALLAALGTSVANVALPTLATEFGIAPGQAQWIVLAYLLAMTATAVQVGRLGDRFGRRRTLLIGLGVFLGATLACALAPSFALLVTARAVQGIGAAVLVALPLALARDLVAPERLGSVMGLLGSAAAIGTALGPAAGGLLLGAFEWQAMFLAVLPVGVVALILLSGSAALGSSGTGAAAGAGDAAAAGAAGAGAAGGPSLAAGPARGATAALLRERAFSAALLMNILVATVMMSTLIVGPFFLTAGLGLSAASVGLTMAVGPAVAAVTGVIAGKVVDSVGASRGTVFGLSIMVLGMAALAGLPAVLGVVGYVLALIVLTPGYQLFLAANNTAALGDIEARRRGAASGMLSLSRNLGLMLGASAMGWLYAAVAGSSATNGASVPVAAVAGSQVTFVLGGVLTLTALGFALALWRARTDRLQTRRGLV